MKRTVAVVVCYTLTAAALAGAGWAGAVGYYITAAFCAFLGVVWMSCLAMAFWLLADL